MRKHRRFGFNQLTGFLMMGAAGINVWRPMSAVLSSNVMAVFTILFLLFGYILAWRERSSHKEFFWLTAPVMAIGTAYFSYVAVHANTSALPSYLMVGLGCVLQYAHARLEEYRIWMSR